MPVHAPLATEVTVDSATWAALALILTLIGAALSYLAWRRRGPAAGIRGLAWTLLPIAAWLTGTLRLAVDILEDVLDWGARLVFSPLVWLGVVLAGGAAALFVLSGVMRARGIGVRNRDGSEVAGPSGRKEVPAPKRHQRTAAADPDDDMADIEAILKKHGI
jgi:hypothetical protein